MCAYRLPRNLSLAYPRSRCSRCGFVIPWYDNIPVLSCIILLAKCRRCKAVFSWSHCVIEFLLGLVALSMFYAEGLSFLSIYYFGLISVMVLVTMIDLEFKIIPDELSLGGLVIGLSVAGASSLFHFSWLVSFSESLVGAIAGGGLLWFVGYAYEKFTGREGMGLGDVKLLAMMGAHVGIENVLIIVFIASFLGSLIGVGLLLTHRIKSKSPIPFGPFLCFSFLIILFGKETFLKVCKVCIPFLL